MTPPATKPRLLFLSQTLPHPPDGGVKIRTFNIFRQLARSFEVTALCFYRWKGGTLHQDVDEAVAALREYGRVEAFPIPQEHSRPRLAFDHLRSVATGRAYTVPGYESRAFRRRLRALLETERFDLVHADSLDLSGYFPLVQAHHIPLICTHHDAQSVLLNRRAEASSGLRRRYLRHQAGLMAREERRWCPRVTMNVTVSGKDAETLRDVAGGGEFTVVPNGVDVQTFQPEAGRDEGIVFVGGTTWFPNKDGLAFFREEILPHLRNGTSPRIHWVGRASEEEIRRHREQYGLELTGYVPDVRPYIRDAACYVVPLRVGGGTRIKILDAWAMGKAVVSTSVGCEGLDAVDGENILIRDAPADFARAVHDVLADSELRRRLGEAARRTVERTYSWEVIGERMVAEYASLPELDRLNATVAGRKPFTTAEED